MSVLEALARSPSPDYHMKEEEMTYSKWSLCHLNQANGPKPNCWHVALLVSGAVLKVEKSVCAIMLIRQLLLCWTFGLFVKTCFTSLYYILRRE